MKKTHKIFVAGHSGMVGRSVVRTLQWNGYTNIIQVPRSELDLRDQKNVDYFIAVEKPVAVIDCAAHVGGIFANDSDPYGFLMDNLLIQTNLIKSSFDHGVEKFIFLGSSCIYPKFAQQPIPEDSLLTGPLESTNQWYATAKISGLKLCEAIRKQFDRDFMSLMPSNLYGPYDNFDEQNSHVLAALLRKFSYAVNAGHQSVEVWGTGKPLREFLYVDDLATAVLFSLENHLTKPWYNVGSGTEISIQDLALLIQKITGHKGQILWDSSKPDGTPRKLLDSSEFRSLGWKPEIDLEIGIQKCLEWFRAI